MTGPSPPPSASLWPSRKAARGEGARGRCGGELIISKLLPPPPPPPPPPAPSRSASTFTGVVAVAALSSTERGNRSGCLGSAGSIKKEGDIGEGGVGGAGGNSCGLGDGGQPREGKLSIGSLSSLTCSTHSAQQSAALSAECTHWAVGIVWALVADSV